MPSVLLLGRMAYTADDDTILETRLRRKTRAVLAYVSLSDRPLSRQHLVDMFAQNANDPHGSLRWHISRIRRNIHENALLIHNNGVEINRDVIRVDARDFADALQPAAAMGEIERALRLYRGELLAGFSLPSETEFEMWLVGQRAYYAQLFEKHTLTLIRHLVETQQYEQALGWAKTLSHHNATLEDVHYWLMWLYARSGQPQVALQHYAAYQEHMQQDYGVSTGDRLSDLQRQIQQNDLPPVAAPATLIHNPEKSQPLFVGRAQELKHLRDQWQAAASGQGSVVLVHGDAGAGKSALIEQFMDSLSPDIVRLSGSCYESTKSAALAPWIRIIRGCLHAFNVTIPPVIQSRLSLLVPDLMPVDVAEFSDASELNAQLLINTLVDYFSLLVAKHTFVVVIEDFHHADEHSIQLLSILLNRLQHMPLLVIITQRTIEADENAHLQVALDEWRSIGHFHAIHLGRLDDDSILRLIERIVPDVEDRQAFSQKLIDHTLGVNLHILEVLYACKSQPHLLDELPVPVSFATLVTQRLRKMSAGQRQILDTLAIMEYPASLGEILECAGQNEVEAIENLDAAMRQRFVISLEQNSRTTYGFSHFLYRDVILDTMADAHKQLLHRRAAELFHRQAVILPAANRRDAVLRTIHHARHADHVPYLIRWIPVAAETAKQTFAYRQALALYDTLDSVLQQTPLLPRHDYIQVLLHMAELYRLLGDWKAQAGILERIRDWHTAEPIADTERLLLFLAEYGTNLFRLGQYKEAVGYLEQTIVMGEKVGNALAVSQAYNSLGNIAYFQADWDAAEAHYLRAIGLRESLNDDIGIAKGYNNLGAIAFHRGDMEKAADYYRSNLDIREKHDDQHGMATALNNLGTVYMTLGQLDDADAQYQRALAIRRKLDDQHGIASTLDNLAQICGLRGDYQASIANNEASLRIREAINDPAGMAHSLAALGESYTNMQQYAPALGYLQRSLDIRRELNARFGMAESMLDLSFARALQAASLPDDMFFDMLQIAVDLDSNYLMSMALEKLAWLYSQHSRPVLAARYAGLVNAQKLDHRRSIFDDTVAALRGLMDAQQLAQEMQYGAQMDLKQAVQDVLSRRASA